MSPKTAVCQFSGHQADHLSQSSLTNAIYGRAARSDLRISTKYSPIFKKSWRPIQDLSYVLFITAQATFEKNGLSCTHASSYDYTIDPRLG